MSQISLTPYARNFRGAGNVCKRFAQGRWLNVYFSRSKPRAYCRDGMIQTTTYTILKTLWSKHLIITFMCSDWNFIMNKFVRLRWPYVMRPSVCHCNSLGGATWRSVTITPMWRSITGRTDRRTDRVRRNMRPPLREEGRIKSARRDANTARWL